MRTLSSLGTISVLSVWQHSASSIWSSLSHPFESGHSISVVSSISIQHSVVYGRLLVARGGLDTMPYTFHRESQSPKPKAQAPKFGEQFGGVGTCTWRGQEESIHAPTSLHPKTHVEILIPRMLNSGKQPPCVPTHRQLYLPLHPQTNNHHRDNGAIVLAFRCFFGTFANSHVLVRLLTAAARRPHFSCTIHDSQQSVAGESTLASRDTCKLLADSQSSPCPTTTAAHRYTRPSSPRFVAVFPRMSRLWTPVCFLIFKVTRSLT